MLGQTFAPLFDPSQQQKPGGPEGPAGAQQAIQVLNTRLPHVVGAGAPAPSALLNSPGSAGLPMEHVSPIMQAILQAVLGHFAPQQQSAPSAMGGMAPTPLPMPGGAPPQLPTDVKPKVNYEPLPGGTAGPNFPPGPNTREDRNNRNGKTGPDYFPVLD